MKRIVIGLIVVGCAFGFTFLGMKLEALGAAQQTSIEPIKVIRLFTGADGQSHVEEIAVPLNSRNSGSVTGSFPPLTRRRNTGAS